jgi:hypothetical protein
MIPTTHNSRPASIYVLDPTIYATYDDGDPNDPDVFFHMEVDDPSLDPRDELSTEFGTDIAEMILTDLGIL